VEEGVIHFCVPNLPAVVARTSTHAFNNAAWPYIQAIVRLGVDAALEAHPALARGVNTRDGQLVNIALQTDEVR
jgi:alanine dehydrogenase